MLQCVAVCCSVLQCVAACCSVLQCVAVCCSVLQCVAVHCSVIQCIAMCCSTMPHRPHAACSVWRKEWHGTAIYVQKETYACAEIVLWLCKKSPISVQKAPYKRVEGALYTCRKSPVCQPHATHCARRTERRKNPIDVQGKTYECAERAL